MQPVAMRRLALALPLAATLLGVGPARARAGEFDLHDVTGFDEYAEDHPATAAQLARNPTLYQDPDWLRRHPTLQIFLHSHPMARAELDEAPESSPAPGEPPTESLTPPKKKLQRYESPLPTRGRHVAHPESDDD